MPIDPSVAIGADLGERSFSWSSSDVLLYHLGIGAGSRPGDNTDPDALRYTTDGPSLQVLPSFGVIAPTFHETEAPSVEMPGVQINLSQVVHGSQAITVHAPLPTAGSATVATRITDVWPDRAPDAETTYPISPQQALLYRLCGDRNPLHSDPDFAKAAGFPAPILHGLCSYGIVLRELTDALLGADATRVGGFAAKFSGVVFPGETLCVRGWREDGRIVGSASVAGGERDGAPVLGDVLLDPA